MSERNQITWTIRVVGAGVQWHMSWQQSKGICYLSANTKLADYSKAVRLASEGLAREFRDAVMETMRKRHGEAVELVVEQGGRKKTLDDETVAARIAQRNFAPNKRPYSITGTFMCDIPCQQ